jgi:hypothetical protein
VGWTSLQINEIDLNWRAVLPSHPLLDISQARGVKDKKTRRECKGNFLESSKIQKKRNTEMRNESVYILSFTPWCRPRVYSGAFLQQVSKKN